MPSNEWQLYAAVAQQQSGHSRAARVLSTGRRARRIAPVMAGQRPCKTHEQDVNKRAAETPIDHRNDAPTRRATNCVVATRIGGMRVHNVLFGTQLELPRSRFGPLWWPRISLCQFALESVFDGVLHGSHTVSLVAVRVAISVAGLLLAGLFVRRGADDVSSV